MEDTKVELIEVKLKIDFFLILIIFFRKLNLLDLKFKIFYIQHFRRASKWYRL